MSITGKCQALVLVGYISGTPIQLVLVDTGECLLYLVSLYQHKNGDLLEVEPCRESAS